MARCGEMWRDSRCHQRPSGAIRGHQRPSEAIRGHQRPSEVIRGHLVRGDGGHAFERGRRTVALSGEAGDARGHARCNLERQIARRVLVLWRKRPPSRTYSQDSSGFVRFRHPWALRESSRVIRVPHESSGVIRSHQGSSGVIRGHHPFCPLGGKGAITPCRKNLRQSA